jgi:hypothetical protein
VADKPIKEEDLSGLCNIVELGNQSAKFTLKEGTHSNQVLTHMIDKGYAVKGFNEIFPGLNEIFIKIVKL